MTQTHVDLYQDIEARKKAFHLTVNKLGKYGRHHWRDWKDLCTQLRAWDLKSSELVREEVNCRREKRETARFKKLNAALLEIEYALEGNIMIYMLKNGINQ